MPKAAIIIPARWGSTRFPGKPLHLIAGKCLLEWVWLKCCVVRGVDRVIVATDDMRIAEAAFSFGAEVALTSSKHPTGTDRVAEVAAKLKGVGVIMNVQGDEPFTDPRLVERLIATVADHRDCDMATAVCPLAPHEEDDHNCVKAVVSMDGRALYFSRSLVPFDRDGSGKVRRHRHLGLYAYRRSFLLSFVRWKPTPLETLEKLEQLRALEHGAVVRVVEARAPGPGIDCPADAVRAEQLMLSGKTPRARGLSHISAKRGR